MNNIQRKFIFFMILLLVSLLSAATYLDTLNYGNELKVEISADNTEKPVEQKKVFDNSKRSVVPNGFRIQIIASGSIEAIRNKKSELEEQVMLPLYISFQSPYYKLLAGNFTKRETAEKELKKMRSRGYKDAWIISSEVYARD